MPVDTIIQWCPVAVFLWALGYAIVSDLRTLTVPNWTSILAAASFLVAAVIAGLGVTTIAMHLAAGALLLAVGALLFACGLMGGGDAKILAAAGTWVGWENLAAYVVVVAFAGGLLAVSVLVRHKLSVRRLAGGGENTAAAPSGLSLPVPYSLAIGIGAVVVLFGFHEL